MKGAQKKEPYYSSLMKKDKKKKEDKDEKGRKTRTRKPPKYRNTDEKEEKAKTGRLKKEDRDNNTKSVSYKKEERDNGTKTERFNKEDKNDDTRPVRLKKEDRDDNTKSVSYKKDDRDNNTKTGRFKKDDRDDRAKTGRYKKNDKDNNNKTVKLKKDEKNGVKPENIRLNAYIAKSGICSRRQADELVKAGKIKINGTVVTEMGTAVKPGDKVEYNGKLLTAEKMVYILLNKPKDTITSNVDPDGRKTVFDLIKGATDERIYSVGRLDRNTTGVLLLTNDGELTEQLTHPKYKKRKIYEVHLNKNLSTTDFEQILEGVKLEEGMVAADALSYVDPKFRSIIGIEIHSGQNRVVRRIFEALGYEIEKLDRVYFAGLTKKDLGRGKWRFLSDKEVAFLKMKRFN